MDNRLPPPDAKPLTFGPEMVRAILAGRKTQTRRLFTPGNAKVNGRMGSVAPGLWGTLDWSRAALVQTTGLPDGLSVPNCLPGFAAAVTPRWTVGDRLYLREAAAPDGAGGWRYAADIVALPPGALRWRLPRFMPRAAARAMLTIEAVRIERVQDISPEDAAAEGLWMAPEGERDAGFWFASPERTPRKVWGEGTVECFERLWTDLHGPAAWEMNPWVAVLSFSIKRLRP